jgi:hypothetical protein
MPTDEMRSVLRHQLETLERWLRRLIDDVLRAHYNGTLSALPIKPSVKAKAAERRGGEPQRYPREVDALLFDDLITIICHPQLYSHFQDGLREAFPDGAAEARTFFKRIVEARNPLAHANDITSHQTLRVACYSTDVIDSLKACYARNNLAQTYNAPSFLRIWDDRGNSAEINASIAAYYDEFRQTQLRPGDTLQLEVQPDESFPDDSYRIEWSVQMANGEHDSGRIFPLMIANHHVTQDGLPIEAKIISNLNWHKHGAYDAKIFVMYSVLPPV